MDGKTHQMRRVAIALRVDQPYPHHQGIYLGIQRYAREHRHVQFVIDEHPAHAFDGHQPSDPYDGVIARASPELQDRLKRMGVPLVNVMFQHHCSGIAGVYPDPRMMGRQAVDHLLDRGFYRLVVMFGQSYRHAVQVSKAFEERAKEAGAQCEVRDLPDGVYREPLDWRRFVASISSVLESITPPTGIFVRNAEAARMIVQHALAKGLHVPHMLAVICEYNIDSIVCVPPQITSINANYDRVGYEAAALLERIIDGEQVPDAPVFVPPLGVVGRETTDYFAAEDELVVEALRYISSRLHEKLRVDDIAYALNISTRYLQIRFSKALGRGVSDEIRRLRFEKAKRLLLEPDRLIGSIPGQVGFATPYVMNQVFKRELGMTPSDYRKKVLGGD